MNRKTMDRFLSKIHLPDRLNKMLPNFMAKYKSGQNMQMNQVLLTVRAIYSYEAVEQTDLTFKAGDVLEILHWGDTSWWHARFQSQPELSGMVPMNFVVELNSEDDFMAQEWWFANINRRMAVKQLSSIGNQRGSFLIRNCRTPGTYCLSIRNYDGNEEKSVKHYRVRQKDAQVFIKENSMFTSLVKLVSHYRESDGGLCCRLSKPCVKQAEVVPLDQLEIDKSEIQLNPKKIGSGNFGEVFAGVWKDKIAIAVKIMKPGTMTKEDFLKEAEVLHQMRHQNLVQLMGICTTTDPIYILTELMEKGSLEKYLRNDRGVEIKFLNLLDMASQIAEGMMYLEENNFIHRDLRAANILVGENHIVKVADFGLARFLVDDQVYFKQMTTKFPVKWTAPEVINYGKFTIKSDVWSFGILLFELVTYGQSPYTGLTNYEAMTKVLEGYRMPNPTCSAFPHIVCPDNVYKLMLECWAEVASERPTFQQLSRSIEELTAKFEDLYADEDE